MGKYRIVKGEAKLIQNSSDFGRKMSALIWSISFALLVIFCENLLNYFYK